MRSLNFSKRRNFMEFEAIPHYRYDLVVLRSYLSVFGTVIPFLSIRYHHYLIPPSQLAEGNLKNIFPFKLQLGIFPTRKIPQSFKWGKIFQYVFNFPLRHKSASKSTNKTLIAACDVDESESIFLFGTFSSNFVLDLPKW